MDYIVNPIAAFLKWTFDFILVPLGELPDIINLNYIFILIGVIGFAYWMLTQVKYNRKSREEGTLK